MRFEYQHPLKVKLKKKKNSEFQAYFCTDFTESARRVSLGSDRVKKKAFL